MASGRAAATGALAAGARGTDRSRAATVGEDGRRGAANGRTAGAATTADALDCRMGRAVDTAGFATKGNGCGLRAGAGRAAGAVFESLGLVGAGFFAPAGSVLRGAGFFERGFAVVFGREADVADLAADPTVRVGAV